MKVDLKKTRKPGLSNDATHVILCVAYFFTRYRFVTDGQINGRTAPPMPKLRCNIAKCNKNANKDYLLL